MTEWDGHESGPVSLAARRAPSIEKYDVSFRLFASIRSGHDAVKLKFQQMLWRVGT